MGKWYSKLPCYVLYLAQPLHSELHAAHAALPLVSSVDNLLPWKYFLDAAAAFKE